MAVPRGGLSWLTRVRLEKTDIGAGRVNPPATRCRDCELRQLHLFRPMSRRELGRIEAMKRSHLSVPAGTDIVRAGQRGRTVYTMFDGWAARYHRLPAGSRQILDVLLPGDTIALGSVMLGTSAHSVQAMTPASLCVLDGRKLATLFRTSPSFAIGILRNGLQDAKRADARLAMLGRMSAEERVGYFIVEIYDRLGQRGMTNGVACPFPLRRTDIADAVGLSRVHVMRALRELRAQGLMDLRGRDLIIPSVARLAAYTGYTLQPPNGTRFIL
ncbi:MAG TPA: Crp/Fnr family transcriptional regulator [Acetobacteraceae bacterium]|jgi:CRP-like cAMP-binding protein|nr:Crp/Fnr family transcriptional regulator [Acetobacteraceae bacterium]